MQLAFESLQLRSVCESEDAARKAFGGSVAQVLKTRLADLAAARTFTDILVGSPRVVRDLAGVEHMKVDLTNGIALAFVPNHGTKPMNQDGSVDWNKVSRIRIVTVGPEDA